jgi:probable phosphoglycerate mutase
VRFYFVRHGESHANVRRQFANAGSGPGLTSTGVEQVHHLLRNLSGIQPARIYTSPLLRAVQTARIVAEVFPAPIEQSEALREWSVGVYEGTTDEAGWEWHRRVQELWFEQGQHDARMPSGESLHDILNRFRPLVEGLVSRAGAGAADTVLVGHGGLYLAALPLVFRNGNPTAMRQLGFPVAAHVVAGVQADGLHCLEWCGTRFPKEIQPCTG